MRRLLPARRMPSDGSMSTLRKSSSAVSVMSSTGCRVPTVPVAPLSIARIHADTDLCSCLNGRLQ